MQARDGYTHPDDDTAHRQISALLDELFADPAPWERATRSRIRQLVAFEQRAAGRAILQAALAEQRAVALALCQRIEAIDTRSRAGRYAFAAYSSAPEFHHRLALCHLLTRLLRKRQGYSADELVELVRCGARDHEISLAVVLGHVERCAPGLTPALRRALEEAREAISSRDAAGPRLAALLDGAPEPAAVSYALAPEEPWSAQACADLADVEAPAPWRALLRHLVQGSGARPTQAWSRRARTLIAAVGAARYAELAARWLALVPALPEGPGGDQRSAAALSGTAGDVLKGLAWTAPLLVDGAPVEALRRAAAACYERVENVGPRCPRAGNACLFALAAAEAEAPAAAAALVALADTVDYRATSRQIERAIERLARRRGVTVEQLRAEAARALALARRAPAQVDPGDLARAADLLQDGDPAGALAVLLESWRACRDPRLAAIIAGVGARLDEARGPLPGRTKEHRLAAFTERARREDPGDLTGLLAALDLDNSRALRPQLAALAGFGADPRIGAALIRLVASPKRHPRQVWQAIFNLLRRQQDPAVLRELEAIAPVFEERLLFPDAWLVDQLQRTLAELRAATDAADSAALPAEALAILEAALAPAEPGAPAVTADLGAALQAIHDAPHDDAARAVYGDLLLEAGDPQGELIALQLSAAPTAAQRKRERALVKAHARAWLGSLEPVILKQRLVFRRGFPAEARVASKRLRSNQHLIGDAAWGTYELIEYVDGHHLPAAAAVDSALRALSGVRGLDGGAALALCRGAPCELELLGCALGLEDGDRADVATGAGLPKLRRLEVEGHAADLGWLLDSPLARRLESLSIPVSYRRTGAVLARVAAASAPPEVTLREDFRRWHLTLRRAAGDAAPALTVTYGGGYYDDETVERLAELLQTLPRLRLGRLEVVQPGRRRAGAAARAALASAAAELGADEILLPA